MEELISTVQNPNGDILVSGRELHEFLEVKTQYTKWLERMKDYGFVENKDFVAISQKRLTAQGNLSTMTDHHLTLSMAKELSMIQRTAKGKQAREYFLNVEAAWNSPEMIMKRALEYADQRVNQLQLENAELQPKAAYYDYVLQSDSLIRITEIAKDYGMSGRQLNTLLHDSGVVYNLAGTWLLYSRYAKKGYTQSKTIKLPNGGTKLHTYWTQEGRLFIYELLKRQGILPTMERKEVADYEVAY